MLVKQPCSWNAKYKLTTLYFSIIETIGKITLNGRGAEVLVHYTSFLKGNNK